VGVFLGLFSVEAYSLFGTGDSYGIAAATGVLMGGLSDEDKISSITRGL